MASGSRRPKHGVDGDGVRITPSGGVRRDVWAIVVLGVGVVAAVALLRPEERAAPLAPEARTAAAAPPAVARPPAPAPATAEATRVPASTGVPTRRRARIAALRRAGVEPGRGADGKREYRAEDVIPLLRAAGEKGGIAAFPPPGTEPVKPGIVVPEGWELPEGYVRYHQTTDDGERLPPILMLHPDYALVDEEGEEIALPPDRIVPPELAPPGLPVEMLDVPGAADRAP